MFYKFSFLHKANSLDGNLNYYDFVVCLIEDFVVYLLFYLLVILSYHIFASGFALAVAIIAICEDFYFLAPKI